MAAIIPRKKTFAGDKKELVHLLVPCEQALIQFLLPKVPKWITTVHLTTMTLFWAMGAMGSGYLAASSGDLRWMWAFNACILGQYVTDMLDGAVGRQRNTGLIKWGFYMDHFLDYIFLCCCIIGYAFLLPVSYFFLIMACLTLSAGFMVHTFLDFSITNDFKISCNLFGVSEARVALLLSNVLVIIFGVGLLVKTFPFLVAGAFIGLCALVFQSQRHYAQLDGEAQEKNTP